MAKESRSDVRSIERLDREPELDVEASFHLDPPFFELTNVGAIPLVQLSVELYQHKYLNGKGAALTGSGWDSIFETLPPAETKRIVFPRLFLKLQAGDSIPPQHQSLEIRLSYRRESDLREYRLGAFYFLTPEGVWAPEGNARLKPEQEYDEVLSAALRLTKIDITPRGDILHRLDPIE